MTAGELSEKYFEIIKYDGKAIVRLVRCKLCKDVLYDNDKECGQVTHGALTVGVALHLQLQHGLGYIRHRRR